MATLLLFGPARSAAAGEGSVQLDATSVRELCDEACRRFGADFEKVLGISALWLNGEPVSGDPPIGGNDEVAVVPPVSGGA